MMILNITTDISIYRTALILKHLIYITFILIPIIIIIMATIDAFKILMNPENAKKSLKDIARRIISAIIIFIIPTVVNYGFTLIEDYNNNNSTILKYFNNASIEKIKELEKQREKELAEAAAKKQAEIKEAYIKAQEAYIKQKELLEEQKKEQDNSNPNNNSNSNQNYYTDTIKDGSYGSVTVNNGVFNIPNTRATSDAQTPKQSGAYGLNPIFWARLEKFINDAAAKGYKITVTSGWRSYSSQKRLWDNSNRPCNERTKWVACPGGSRHGWGIAADLAFNGTGCSKGGWNCNAAAKWAHENAEYYGLKFRMSWEPWHIEPIQVNGGKYGSCKVKC